jgi:hypothetical protein
MPDVLAGAARDAESWKGDAGDLCVCVNADRDLVRDVGELVAGVEAELEELALSATR